MSCFGERKTKKISQEEIEFCIEQSIKTNLCNEFDQRILRLEKALAAGIEKNSLNQLVNEQITTNKKIAKVQVQLDQITKDVDYFKQIVKIQQDTIMQLEQASNERDLQNTKTKNIPELPKHTNAAKDNQTKNEQNQSINIILTDLHNKSLSRYQQQTEMEKEFAQNFTDIKVQINKLAIKCNEVTIIEDHSQKLKTAVELLIPASDENHKSFKNEIVDKNIKTLEDSIKQVKTMTNQLEAKITDCKETMQIQATNISQKIQDDVSSIKVAIIDLNARNVKEKVTQQKWLDDRIQDGKEQFGQLKELISNKVSEVKETITKFSSGLNAEDKTKKIDTLKKNEEKLTNQNQTIQQQIDILEKKREEIDGVNKLQDTEKRKKEETKKKLDNYHQRVNLIEQHMIKQLHSKETNILGNLEKVINKHKETTTVEKLSNQMRKRFIDQTSDHIRGIGTSVEDYGNQIDQFHGTRTDKTYLHIKEMLQRCIERLDKIEPYGLQEIKMERKQLIRRFQELQAMLENKVFGS